jgi:hypothetical protein
MHLSAAGEASGQSQSEASGRFLSRQGRSLIPRSSVRALRGRARIARRALTVLACSMRRTLSAAHGRRDPHALPSGVNPSQWPRDRGTWRHQRSSPPELARTARHSAAERQHTVSIRGQTRRRRKSDAECCRRNRWRMSSDQSTGQSKRGADEASEVACEHHPGESGKIFVTPQRQA